MPLRRCDGTFKIDGMLYENALEKDQCAFILLSKFTEPDTDHAKPIPLETRQTTDKSFCHLVDEHAVAPMRAATLREDIPVPKTTTYT